MDISKNIKPFWAREAGAGRLDALLPAVNSRVSPARIPGGQPAHLIAKGLKIGDLYTSLPCGGGGILLLGGRPLP
jgi:hypothetical protein